jgi:hypothetical protein
MVQTVFTTSRPAYQAYQISVDRVHRGALSCGSRQVHALPLVRGIEASEITSGVRSRPHSLTPWAQVKGIRVTYAAAGPGASQSALRASWAR